MNKYYKSIPWVLTGILLPVIANAQDGGVADDLKGLQGVLKTLYDQMILQCSALIDVGRAIAGFAAIWYIGSRVWRHIANAEPVDFYPLFRPFVMALLIAAFPAVISLMNGIMQPTVTGTESMVKNSDQAVGILLKAKEDAVKNTDQYKWFVGPSGNGDEDLWEKYSGNASTGTWSGITNPFKFAMAKMSYNFRNEVKQAISEILQVLYQAAALCINTLRTFNLIILAILGPIVFGLSVFDGFQHTLRAWVARYINLFLWLPVANIFGAVIGNIQENMLKLDLAQIQARGDTYFSTTDAGYLIFLVIGIVGYFTVPTIAGHIIDVGGPGAMVTKISRMSSNTAGAAAGMAGTATGSVLGRAGQGMQNLARAPFDVMTGYQEGGNKNKSRHQQDKISGKK